MRREMATSLKYAVSLFSAEKKIYVPAKFEKCCLSVLGNKGNKMEVAFQLKGSVLKICLAEQGIRLEHPSSCPCRFLTPSDIASLSDNCKESGVRVGVSFVIQSADGHVLLTKRPKAMRSFPNIWVTPGGHIEEGESLTSAGIREVLEETGVLTMESNVTTLGLWESVFPPVLAMGLPKAHHIVVYMLAQLSDKYGEIQLKLQESEVSAAAWLDEFTVAEIVKSDEYGKTRNVSQRYFRARVLENGEQVDKDLPLSPLMACIPHSGNWNQERLSSGSKFALRQWLKFRYSSGVHDEGKMTHGDSFETVFHMITKQGHNPNPSPFW